MTIRPLSNELQRKAEDELNENSTRVKEDLEHIREWLVKQPHLSVRQEDQWLLTFLRGCKFSLERTKEKLDNYYTLKTLIPEFFANRDPFLPEIQEILASGSFWIPLPKSTDPAAPRVLFIYSALLDSEKITAINVMKVNFMIFDILMNEDDNFNVSGHHMFQDVKGCPTGLMLQATPGFIKKCAACFRAGYPIRSNGLHFINIPSLFEAIIRPFLLGKHVERVFIDSSANYENLHKLIPPSLLPEECGGENASLQKIIAEWRSKVESYRDWFLEDVQYCSEEANRPVKPKTSGELFGVEGSFRKLDID